ncbi:MAG: hemerythrin family protein [Rhodoferax sp.]|nr:hemerythrin family protein [Rhodoferax sp.]
MSKLNDFKAHVTGIASMDFEHSHLLKQLERMYQASSFEDAKVGVDGFIEAWKLHHGHEDQLMQDIAFPGAAAHIEGHSRLYEIYHRLRDDALQGGGTLSSAKAYIDMVAQLVCEHIRHYDVQYADWAKLHCTPQQIALLGFKHPPMA